MAAAVTETARVLDAGMYLEHSEVAAGPAGLEAGKGGVPTEPQHGTPSAPPAAARPEASSPRPRRPQPRWLANFKKVFSLTARILLAINLAAWAADGVIEARRRRRLRNLPSVTYSSELESEADPADMLMDYLTGRCADCACDGRLARCQPAAAASAVLHPHNRRASRPAPTHAPAPPARGRAIPPPTWTPNSS